MSKFYHWFYQRYWWLLLALFAVTFWLPLATGALSAPVSMVVLLGANIAVFYFTQKQRLADQRLASEVMMHFNGRLTQMQPKVQALHNEGDVGEFTPEQRDDLAAYFDLCGQFYFQFAGNHIPPTAWQAWLNRMRIYYYNPRIRRAWDAELKKDVYHGFDNQMLK